MCKENGVRSVSNARIPVAIVSGSLHVKKVLSELT